MPATETEAQRIASALQRSVELVVAANAAGLVTSNSARNLLGQQLLDVFGCDLDKTHHSTRYRHAAEWRRIVRG